MINIKYIPSLLIGLFLVAFLSSHGQFTVLNSGVDADLLCVQFVDDAVGYAAGTKGALVKTRNGGRHWTVLNAKTSENINDVYFITHDAGLIVGENNVFKRTSDGGDTWKDITDMKLADFTNIHFVDSITGFVIGHSMEGGIFCKTVDGGKTWSTRMINQDCSGNGLTPGIDCDDIYLTEMSFLDDQRGLIAGFTYNFTYGKQPFICKTDDGGVTFKDISPKDDTKDWYYGKEVVSVNYMNNHDACAVMNTGIGTDFMFISDYSIHSFEMNQLPSNFSSPGRFFTSNFLGRFIGYFAGLIDGESQIIKTVDQGNSFMFLNPPTDNTLYASCFIDQNTGYFVGENGIIIRLTDHSNIVYAAANQMGEYEDELPYSIATVKRKNTLMQVHIYNLTRTNPRNFRILVKDSDGNLIPIKPKSVRIYSDEIRIKVRIEDILPTTYFYSVEYANRTVVNGKLDGANYAHAEQ